MNDRIPVILDTDIGSDIDDAVCLAYLLAQPRCELVGITTVTGEDPRQRSSLAEAMCRLAGRSDIPISTGARVRMDTGTVMQPSVWQASVLSGYAHRRPEDFAANTAVQWLHRAISERPGEITLLAIGPMTNLGLLFALDPTIASKLKALVMMIGVFHNNSIGRQVREWNAFHDPLASAWTYRPQVPMHRSVGLDVTTRVQLPSPEGIERFRSAGGPLGMVSDIAQMWSTQNPMVTFHDPLAAACIFDPGICTWARGTVTVEQTSPRLEGLTHFERRADGPHEVAETVDAGRFFDEYFSIVERRG